MSKIFQLKYRNLDLTRDINERFVGLIVPGIISGGDITAIPSQLRVNVSPWKVYTKEGMVVRETSEIATLDVNPGQVNVIALRAVYVANGAPIASLEVIELGLFQGLPNIDEYIIMGYIDVPVAASEVLDAYIDLRPRMVIDQVKRFNMRGVVSSSSLLPPKDNLNGDLYIVTDGTGLSAVNLYGWNGLAWNNMTDVIALRAEVTQHRQNLFANEKHLTDAEKDAVVGTSGVPSSTNKFVTDVDTRVPTQSENDALQGSHGSPSDTNRYVTQALEFAQPTTLNVASGTSTISVGLGQGPVFLGRGGVDSHLQYFRLYHSTLDREYVNTDTSYSDVVQVYKDAGLTQLISDPGSEALTVIDQFGFYIGGTLYLKLDTTVDQNSRLVYSKRSNLGTYKLDFLLDNQPRVAQIHRDLLSKFEEVTGRKFDDPTLARETNLALANELGDVKQYINSNSSTDIVVSNFKKMNAVPGYEGLFPNNVGLMSWKYHNDPALAYSYDNSTGTVTYTGSPNLGSVLPNHVFIDGNLREFKVLSVGGNIVVIRNRDGSIPYLISTSILDDYSGSIKVDDNPRQINLSTLKVASYRDRISASRLSPLMDEFHPTTSQIAFEISDPLKSMIYREPRVRAYGNWQTRNVENPLVGPNAGPKTQVYSVNSSRLVVTDLFTDLELIYDALPTSDITLAVTVDGISSYNVTISSTENSFTDMSEIRQRNIAVANNLSDGQIHTVEIVIPNVANEFVFYGFDLIRRNYSNASIAPGRAFVQGDIVYSDSINSLPINPVSPLERGGVANWYYNRDLELSTDAYARTTFDGSIGGPGGSAVIGAGSIPVSFGIPRFNSYYKAGDIVKVVTALNEEVKVLTSTAANTATFSSTLTIGGVAALIHLCSTTGDTLDPEVEVRRINAEGCGLATLAEFSATPPLLVDRMAVMEDGATKFTAQQISFVDTGVEGYERGIQFPNASSRLRITACVTRLDIIVATPGNVAFQYTVNGSSIINKATSTNGYARINLINNARFQTFEIDIFNAANLIIAGFILHEPEAEFPIEGTRLGELKILARYQATNPNALGIVAGENYPLGSVGFDAYTSFVRFKGVFTPWVSSIDFSKLYGRYTRNNSGDASFEFDFYGDAFEIEYTATSDSGYAAVSLNGISARISNITAVYKGMNQVNGIVDMYAATPTRRRFSISSLPYNRYTVRVSVPNSPQAKNPLSSDYYINVNQVFFVNSTGYFGYANQLAKSSVYYLGYSNAYDRRDFGNGVKSFDDLIAIVGQTYNLTVTSTEDTEVDGGTFN